MQDLIGQLGKGVFQRSENVDSKIQVAEKEKNLGNECFKKGENQKALKHYHQALLNLNGLVGLSNDETKQVNNLKVLVNNNMAAVYIKNGNLPKALNASNIVLQIEPKNVKALFRRGKAYLDEGNLDRAEADLMEAEKLDPEDKGIKKEIQVLKKKIKEDDKKKQKFYSNMFSKIEEENQKAAQEPSSEESKKEENDA
jgi:tetratricopeptide (TPR) repeat protein